MNNSVEVRQVPAGETIELRHRVMWPNSLRADMILDGDADAIHFGAFIGCQLVGVGSFFGEKNKFRLRKLAVDDAYQRQGIASQLLNVAIEELRKHSCQEIWCNARFSALGFYIQNGFYVEEDIFQKRGLDYVVARRAL